MEENLWKSLGTIGIAPKGTYNPDTIYYRGHLVSYEGSSYVALKNELINITPTDDDVNWSLVMKGYNEKIIQATIPATGWVGDTAPYTQTITVEGISEDDNPVVDIILSDDIETMQAQLEDYGKILKITTGDGNITVYSSDLTTTDLTILIQGISFSTEEYKETTANEVGITDTYDIVGNGAGSKGILQTFLDTVANKLGIFGESKDGLVPKPSATEGKFLCDDGTWKNPLQGVSSVFSLQLDVETGDLYAVYPDGMDAPQFEYDSDTGNLYYITSD